MAESVTWKEGCIINPFFFFSENAFSVFCDSFKFWILQQVYKKFSNLISILVISCLLQLFLLVKCISFGRMPEYFFCISGMSKYSRIASWHRALFMFISICLCFRGTPLLPRYTDIGVYFVCMIIPDFSKLFPVGTIELFCLWFS